jgi:hypothetical protein
MKQLPLNVGLTISTEFLDFRRKIASLNYGIIITRLCASQEVKIDPKELMDAKRFGRIDKSFFYRYIFNKFYGTQPQGRPLPSSSPRLRVDPPRVTYLDVSPSIVACLARDFETPSMDEKLSVSNNKMEVDHANDWEMKSQMMRNVCFGPFGRMMGAKHGINMDMSVPTPFSQEEYNRANQFYEYGSGSSKGKEKVVEEENDEEEKKRMMMTWMVEGTTSS